MNTDLPPMFLDPVEQAGLDFIIFHRMDVYNELTDLYRTKCNKIHILRNTIDHLEYELNDLQSECDRWAEDYYEAQDTIDELTTEHVD